MEKKVINQGVKTSESGVKIRKSTVPGVTLVEYKENVPEGYSAPDILRRPISLTLQEGKIANFKAVVQGNPKPSVVWSFKEKHLTNDNHYKIYQDTVTKEHILQVIQLTSDDAGSYKCIFSNEYGEARCVTNLNIIEVGFKKKMKKPEATKENLPDPTAFRKMLRKRALPVKRQDNVPDEKVWEILMNADKKDYEKICLQYGITDFRGMLTRLKQMKIEREEKQAAYLKYIGNLKHIETKADGSANFGFDMELKNPNLSIFLYKDEEMIPLSMSEDGKHQLRHVGKRYNFCIKDLQPEDVGMYKINVEDTSVFATEVDIYHIPVAFKQSLQECRCNETEDAVFGSTISVPLPVEWLYKNLTLEDSDKYQITVSPDGLTHRLIVKDVTLEDRGVYTIIAGARSSSAHLTVGKNLDATSRHSRSEKNSSDINLKQDLDGLKKDNTKGITDRLTQNKDITKDGLKERNNLSEADRTRFDRRGLQDSTGDGLYGNDLSDIGKYDRMGKDSSVIGRDGLGRMDEDGLDRLHSQGKDNRGRLDGMGKDGKGSLVGMNEEEMGIGGKGRQDGIERYGGDRLGGIGADGMEIWDAMGKSGKGQLIGEGKDRIDNLGEMGKDASGILGGLGKHGKVQLGGMGLEFTDNLEGVGKNGQDSLYGMGNEGNSGWGGMRKEGKGTGGKDRPDGLGKGGMAGLDGMGKGGVAGLDGMGKGGMGGLDGMAKGGVAGLDGMGKGGMAGVDGMGKGGMGDLDGMGKSGVAGVDGMGKGGMGALDGMGKGGMGGLDGMGKGGVAGLDGMGKRGMGGLDGMGKGGVAGLDGMGKGSVGGLDGMGKGGMAGLDGRGTAGKGRLEGTGKNGKDVWDGLGKDMKGRENAKDKWNEMEESDLHVLEGMGKDGKSRLFGVGKDGNNSLVGISKDQLDGSGPTDMKGSSSKSRLNTFGSNQDKSGLEGYSGSAFSGIAAKDGGGFEAINALSTAGELSSMSGSAGDVNDGSTSSAGNKRGLLGDGQMSIRDESMDESKRGLLASDLSQSHARRRHRKLSESELTGNKKLQSKEAAHYFKSGLSDISAKKGEAAELCCVTKNEEAQGSWFKDGKKITSGNGKVITKEGAVQKLTFGHIQEEDSGIYTFEADGGRTEASLFVEDPPEFDQDMLDQLGKKPILVKAGHTATVKVQFKGKQPMKVSWYKDGDELFNDKRIKIDNAGNFTRLSISNCNRKDSGILTAKLKNESGTASTDNISLCVIDKPQAPQGPIEVLESSESCISFKWKPPKDDGGKPITNYIIERQLVGRNTWTKVGEKDVSETTFSVPKVQPGKNYKFKVWAVNSEGVSEALLSDTITAGRRDVPGPVATPKILNANSKSITLSWTPPKKIGSSRLIGYLIEKRKEGSNTWIVVTDHPITEKKWTVTDVVEGLKYEFRVIAVNSSGLGEPSCETEAVFAREPIRPPGTVRDLRMIDSTYSTISLAWTPPTYQDNGEAKGYIVEMKSSGSAAWTRCNPVPIALNSYTVKNLKPMGSYFLRVTAVNDGGMGEPVELDSYVLAMPPPVAPKFKLDESFKSFMIIKEGNSFQVQLPFQASPPPEVIWLKDGSPLRKQVAVTNTNDGTQLFIPACQRSDSGIYSIILKNPFGQDSFSFEIRATAIPKPPGLLTLNENVPNTVTVSWEPSRDEPLDDHLHYVVKKRDSSRQMWHTIGDNIFNNKFTVINVIPGRKYYFRVLAKNDLGYSDPSDMVEPWGITKQRDSITLKLPDYKGVNNISAPEFTVKLKTHTAPTGSDVCMSCAVKGYPPPNVTWFKDNISITNNANFWSTNVCGVCSLCIFAASPKQSGEYMAFAENMAGRATCSTRLNIRD